MGPLRISRDCCECVGKKLLTDPLFSAENFPRCTCWPIDFCWGVFTPDRLSPGIKELADSLRTQRSDLLCTGMLADSKAQRPRTHLPRCACSPTGPTPVFEEQPPRNECIREQVWMCCVMKTRVWGWTAQPLPANSNATHNCACQNKWLRLNSLDAYCGVLYCVILCIWLIHNVKKI